MIGLETSSGPTQVSESVKCCWAQWIENEVQALGAASGWLQAVYIQEKTVLKGFYNQRGRAELCGMLYVWLHKMPVYYGSVKTKQNKTVWVYTFSCLQSKISIVCQLLFFYWNLFSLNKVLKDGPFQQRHAEKIVIISTCHVLRVAGQSSWRVTEPTRTQATGEKTWGGEEKERRKERSDLSLVSQLRLR